VRVVTGSRRIAAAVASGLLLAAAFPKWNLAVFAWIGFVPLLLAVRGVRPLRAAFYGWITGFVWQLVTIYWIPATISNFTAIPQPAAQALLLLLGGFCAYPFVLFAAGIEWGAARGVPRLVFAPALWPVAEWLRVVFIAGFPWNPVGNTQIAFPVMAQAADLGSVYLLSSAIVAANVALAEAWALLRRERAPRSRVGAYAATAAVVPLLLFGYGVWRLDQLGSIPYSGSIRIGVAQGNIAQEEKWNARRRDEILATYLRLTEQAADAGAKLVVWPEASLPFYFQHDLRSTQLSRIAKERRIDLLVGAPGLEVRGAQQTPYNQAWLVRADGTATGPYDKIQLVPFGEYIPMFGLFGMVDVAVQSVGQLGQGREYTIFDTAELTPLAGAAQAATDRRARFATLICYEGIFPALTREFAARGADFFLNISNDAWYGDTSAPHQHLAMAAMRTIENRIPMVRSTNTGVSAFITDEGWIGSTTPLFEEDVVVETLLVRDVWSFYREYGDVFLHAAQILTIALLLLGWRRGRTVGEH
jgi:apolipoprotein N-acyltransferase